MTEAGWFQTLLAQNQPEKPQWMAERMSKEAYLLLDSASYLPEHPPEVAEAIIAPFIRPGDMACLVSESGVGKSNLAADIILACLQPDLTSGHCVGGLWRANQTRFPADATVCILDGEQTAFDWTQLFKRALSFMDLDWATARRLRSNLLHLSSEVVGLDRAASRSDAIPILVEALVAAKTTLLVIDPSVAVFAPKSMMDEDWIIYGLRPLRLALRAAGITSLVLTHTARQNKDNASYRGKPFGSSMQEATFDSWFYIEPAHQGTGTERHRVGVWITYAKGRRAWWVAQGTKAKLLWGDKGGGYLMDEDPHWLHTPPAEALTPAPLVLEFLQSLSSTYKTQLSLQDAWPHRRSTFTECRSYCHETGLIELKGGTGRKGLKIRLTDSGLKALNQKEVQDGTQS